MSRMDKEAAVLDAQFAALGRKQMPRATASALNKTAALARTRTIRGVSKQAGIQQKLIRKRVYVRKAKPKEQRASVRAYIRGVSLIRMKPRDSGRGGWRTRRGDGVKARGGHHYSDAFIAKSPKGHLQVFERNLKVSRRNGRKYHHVDVVRVPISREVEAIAPRVVGRLMRNRFPGLLQHEMDWRLKKLGVK